MFHGTKKSSVENMKSKFEPSKGKLNFRIHYDVTSGDLFVTVIKCTNLPKKDVLGSVDPYVRIYVLPGTHKEIKTKTVKKNQNPIFNENFQFKIPPQEINTKTVVFQLFDYDRFTKNDPLGEVQVPLFNQFVAGPTIEDWKDLMPITGKPGMPLVNANIPMERSRSSSPASGQSLKGRIQYSVKYDPVDKRLNVTVKQCQNLPKADVTGSIDPFVRLYLVPGQHKEIRTKVQNKNQNPVFNESFQFSLNFESVTRKTLVLQVFDFDKLSKNDGIGEAQIPLWKYNLLEGCTEWKTLEKVSGKPGAPVTHELAPSTPVSSPSSRPNYSIEQELSKLPANYKGKIRFSLGYSKPEMTLNVAILECQGLPKADSNGSIDPYVRLYLLPGTNKEIKTKVVKNNQNPTFNETFKFQGGLAELRNKAIVLQVYDYDRLSKNDPIGEVQIYLWKMNMETFGEYWMEFQPITGKPGMPIMMERPQFNSQPRRPSARSRSRSRSRSKSRSPSPDRSLKPMPTGDDKGRIHYMIQYIQPEQKLVVTVVECQGLPKADVAGSIDPYVRVYLMPGKHEIIKTKTIKKNYNPVFNEVFDFKISGNDIFGKTVVLQVYDDDRLTKDDAIGEAQIPLWQIDAHFVTDSWESLLPVTGKPGQPVLIESMDTSYTITSTTTTTASQVRQSTVRSRSSSSSGKEDSRPPINHNTMPKTPKLHFSAEYDRSRNYLEITVLECQALPKADLTGSIDAYVRVFLVPGTHKEMKTKVIKKNQDPVFNESFGFQIDDTSIQTATLIFQIYDYDRISKDDAIGEVQVPLWNLNLSALTNSWMELQKVTKAGQPIPHFQNAAVAVTRRSRSRSRSSSSSSSSDEERKASDLGLKELNNRLIKYVDQVHLLQQTQNYSVSVNIDRKELEDIRTSFNHEVDSWRNKYENSEMEHSKTKNELDRIRADLARIEYSLSGTHSLLAERDSELKVKERDLSDTRLQLNNITTEKTHWASQKSIMDAEIERLKMELNHLRSELEKERLKGGELELKLQTMMKDYEFKLSMLEKELRIEQTKTTVDVTSVDGQLKVEYEARFKSELRKLRRAYEEMIKATREEFMLTYSKKIGELERQLEYEQRNNTTAGVEVKDLYARLETLKQKIFDLETQNLELNRKNAELANAISDKAALYKGQISAKDKEIEFLRKEITEVREEYEKMRGLKMQEMAEVKVYGEVLVPELERIIRYSQSRSRAQSRTRALSRSSSSSSDEEKRSGSAVSHQPASSFGQMTSNGVYSHTTKTSSKRITTSYRSTDSVV